MVTTPFHNEPHLFADYGRFLSGLFPFKVQKLSVNGGFGCPNRDGTLSHGGCAYCNNQTFVPAYCLPTDSIRQQLEKGKLFFRRKYPDMRFLAYFQAHTNTYAPLPVLRRAYHEALSVDGVVGLVIGTRPDCVSPALLDELAELSQRVHVLIEYGVESTRDEQLSDLGRGHTFKQAEIAIRQTAERGIYTAAHMILGLPGDTPETLLLQPAQLSALPIHVLKLHQLQIVRHTLMENQYAEHPERFDMLFATPEQYASFLCQYIARLRPTIVLERFTSQSPSEMLIAPRWGIKNHEFVALLRRELKRQGLWQGKHYGV
ncbi:MAG: TIGR01212 family radical SAM protein [Bacteroidaceae bacterium]|nr:TIGR01212 family radical SAM protein [Bacteroidaceae bacterium]